MLTEAEYALFASDAYRADGESLTSRVILPENNVWKEKENTSVDEFYTWLKNEKNCDPPTNTGFFARTYTNSATHETIIAFRGNEQGDGESYARTGQWGQVLNIS